MAGNITSMTGVYEIDGLNCYEAHVRRMIPGDELRYGWALAPDGVEYQHNWILRNGEILDYFEWADHVDMGRRYVPYSSEYRSSLPYENRTKRISKMPSLGA